MTRGRGRLLGAVLLAALLSMVLAVPANATQDWTSAGFETVLRGTNDYRELNGKGRLVHDPRLSAVAQAWAEKMASDFAASTNPDRSAALQAAFRHNPTMPLQVPAGWQSVGENIAYNGGYSEPYGKLLELWRNSPGHNENMLRMGWTHIGIGTFQDAGGLTWGVQVFGDYGSPESVSDPVDVVVDVDALSYSGTAACVVLVAQPSNADFFRQCGMRAGNAYTFSDVPPGSYSATVLDAGGDVLYSGATDGVNPPGVFLDVPASHPFHTYVSWLTNQAITSGYGDSRYGVGDPVTRGQMAVFMYRLAGSPAYTPPASSKFSDAPTSHPYFKYVSWLASRSITSGYSDGRFGVTDPVTRGQLAVFMYRLAGSPAYTPPASATLTDVGTAHSQYKYVSWLASKSITSGYADGSFGAIDPVTRGQMAVFMYRYAHLT